MRNSMSAVGPRTHSYQVMVGEVTEYITMS